MRRRCSLRLENCGRPRYGLRLRLFSLWRPSPTGESVCRSFDRRQEEDRRRLPVRKAWDCEDLISATPLYLSSRPKCSWACGPPKRMKIGLRKAWLAITPNFVISTGAQRSGEICGFPDSCRKERASYRAPMSVIIAINAMIVDIWSRLDILPTRGAQQSCRPGPHHCPVHSAKYMERKVVGPLRAAG